MREGVIRYGGRGQLDQAAALVCHDDDDDGNQTTVSVTDCGRVEGNNGNNGSFLGDCVAVASLQGLQGMVPACFAAR